MRDTPQRTPQRFRIEDARSGLFVRRFFCAHFLRDLAGSL
jgi:hypothetical protein